jgi:hypothetical protein
VRSGDADVLPPLGGDGHGPAEMEVEVTETGDGACSVSLMTTTAGEYSVTVWGFGTSYYGGEAKVPLGDSPLQVPLLTQPSRFPLVASTTGGEQQSVATPQAARGWARPPCRHFKSQSCCCVGSAFLTPATNPCR